MCRICKCLFDAPLHLSRHMYEHQKKEIICDICEQTFYFPSELKKHCIVHCTNPGHQCMKAKCGCWLMHEADLTFHLSTHGKKLWKCSLCDKFSTTSEKYLKDHIKGAHSDELPYKCPNCKERFKWRQQVTQHINMVQKKGG